MNLSDKVVRIIQFYVDVVNKNSVEKIILYLINVTSIAFDGVCIHIVVHVKEIE
jgi:hypothetical protein